MYTSTHTPTKLGIAYIIVKCYNERVFEKAGVAEWQTHMTQNHAGNRVGSSPTTGTKKGRSLSFI